MCDNVISNRDLVMVSCFMSDLIHIVEAQHNVVFKDKKVYAWLAVNIPCFNYHTTRNDYRLDLLFLYRDPFYHQSLQIHI